MVALVFFCAWKWPKKFVRYVLMIEFTDARRGWWQMRVVLRL